jgi:hypothetical protein
VAGTLGQICNMLPTYGKIPCGALLAYATLWGMSKAQEAAKAVPPKCLTIKSIVVQVPPLPQMVNGSWWATSGHRDHCVDK